MRARYVECSAKDVPDDIRFDVPRRNQGQMVEIAYGDRGRFRGENDEGSPYKRVTDGSDRSVTYYRLDEVQP